MKNFSTDCYSLKKCPPAAIQKESHDALVVEFKSDVASLSQKNNTLLPPDMVLERRRVGCRKATTINHCPSSHISLKEYHIVPQRKAAPHDLSSFVRNVWPKSSCRSPCLVLGPAALLESGSWSFRRGLVLAVSPWMRSYGPAMRANPPSMATNLS